MVTISSSGFVGGQPCVKCQGNIGFAATRQVQCSPEGMAMYSQGSKRQKTSAAGRAAAGDARGAFESAEHFPGINKLEYRPDASVDDSLCYRYYSPGERVHGRPMEEWVKPAISLHHTFNYQGTDKFGTASFSRSWDEGLNLQDIYKKRVRAAFELCSKLGIKYWTGYDRDLAPEGENIDESNQFLDETVEIVVDLQQKSNIKPLWFGCNLFMHPRYMNGASTSNDSQVLAYAGTQMKKSLEAAMKMQAENFMIWLLRDAVGYKRPLTTDVPKEIRLYARFLKMAAEYKEKIGYRGQLLIKTGRSPDQAVWTNNGGLQDAARTMYVLKHYALDKHFKLCIYPGREHAFVAAFNMMYAIAIPSKFKNYDRHGQEVTQLFKTLLEQGIVQQGGFTMEMELNRESTDLKDIFVLYAQQLDNLARSLKAAARLVNDGLFTKNIQQKYVGYQSGFGQRVVNGDASLEDCEEYVKRHGEPSLTSAHCEHWTAIFHSYNNL